VGTPYAVNVAELLRRPGSQLERQFRAPAEALRVVDAFVPEGEDIDVDVVLESLTDGIVVRGRLATTWEGTCRRCLEPVRGTIETDVRELYQHEPVASESFAFRGELLDLEPMVRETVVLELPLAPLCRPDCAGLCPACGANLNEGDCGHRPPADNGNPAFFDQDRA
jgi:uncharacterized protein